MLSFDGGGSVSAAVIHHSASGGITMTAALLLALLAAFLVTLVWGLGLTLLVDTIVGARRRLLGVFLLEHLYALARMELPLGRGLGECATRMWANSRHDVSLIARSLNAGVPLGDALSLTTAENPAGPIPPRRLISPAEAEILRIGESSGNLVEALRLVTQERRRSAEARSLLFAGFLYPMLVIILTSGVVALIFWQILPKFRKMFEELDVQAPSILMLNHLGLLWRILPFIGFVLMLFFVLLLFLPALHRPLQRARGHISDLVLRLGSFLPGIGGNMRRAALGEFCYELAMLVRAGVPAPHALQTIASGTIHPWLRDRIQLAAEKAGQGSTLAEALDQAKVDPRAAWFARGLAGSEELSRALTRLGEDYSVQTSWTAAMVSQLLPALAIMGVGVAVALIVLGVFTPLLKIVYGLTGW